MEKTSILRSKPSSVSLMSVGIALPLLFGATPFSALAQTAATSVKKLSEGSSLPKLKDRGAPVGRQRGGASPNNATGTLPKLKDRGAPTGRRRGGASRNNCPTASKPLTALVPGVESTSGQSQRSISYMASTAVAYPTFWVYVPAGNQARAGEFVLQNKAGEDLYRTDLPLSSASGSIGINLPNAEQYALQPDQEYHWYFKLYCGDSTAQSEYFYVDAWLKRESPAPNTPSASAATTDVAGSQSVFWYDTLTRSARSQGRNWSNLLVEAGLQDVADEPIIEQFSPQ
ncbi:hypothetical protein C1752_08854 [Acaryochloris thomasi RCC1774]|uniref:DUF928 domain-containing protein n=1 Tax=Acaryochloris thomasi RCC1774 TaxID=1764569 RepID=A0A2W1J9E9_9CYAN|nr:DUF928 domain-containing protein [Acaryochloris thomasi]PZD70860.1 hypothetical protein C1752_08854 [Acaryochloris thomasi RCC1774]